MEVWHYIPYDGWRCYTIYHLMDGGVTLYTIWWMEEVWHYVPYDGWRCGTIYHTMDGGVALYTIRWMEVVHYIPYDGWRCGTIYHTMDGGVTLYTIWWMEVLHYTVYTIWWMEEVWHYVPYDGLSALSQLLWDKSRNTAYIAQSGYQYHWDLKWLVLMKWSCVALHVCYHKN